MIVFMAIFAYLIGSGTFFVVLGNKFCPNDYWEDASPALGAIFWPLFVPMFIGGSVGRKIINKGPDRKTRRLKAEIEAAEHRLALAKINHNTTLELEKALHKQAAGR